MDILSNPWIITIIGGTVVGLLLYFVFGIGKIGNGKDKKPERIGILNNGKNNQFINNHFEGLEIGIKDEGEGTVAKGNDFR